LFDAGHRAVLDAGKPLVYVCPPAPWATAPLFSYLVHDTARPTNAARPIRNLIVTGTVGAAEDFRSALRPVGTYVHPVTGLARVERLLRTGGANGEAVADLAVRAADAQELVRRAVLKLDRVERIVLAWPEALLEAGAGEDLDLLLSEAAAGEAQRIILTSDSELLSGFLERHARRAPTATYAEPPPPQRRAPMIRSVITDPLHRRATCIDVLDVTNRQRVLVWDPATAGGLSDLDRYPDVTVIESAGPTSGPSLRGCGPRTGFAGPLPEPVG
jgi:hypothetical protein